MDTAKDEKEGKSSDVTMQDAKITENKTEADQKAESTEQEGEGKTVEQVTMVGAPAPTKRQSVAEKEQNNGREIKEMEKETRSLTAQAKEGEENEEGGISYTIRRGVRSNDQLMLVRANVVGTSVSVKSTLANGATKSLSVKLREIEMPGGGLALGRVQIEDGELVLKK